MVDWHRFDPAEWDIEYDANKLEAHQVAEWEAAELIWNGFEVRANQGRRILTNSWVGQTPVVR